MDAATLGGYFHYIWVFLFGYLIWSVMKSRKNKDEDEDQKQ